MPLNNESYTEEFIISTTSSSNLESNIGNLQQQQQQNQATSSSVLTKYEGQKWEEVFDFEKILKQITNAEKKYLRRNCPSATCKNNLDQAPINLNSPPRSPSIKCSRQTNQVQRLNGDDMHYYGLAPLQEAIEVVVCNYCSGTYTKKGLNNHMILHHPHVWNNTPTKLPSPPDVHSIATSGSVSIGLSASMTDATNQYANQDNTSVAIPATAANAVSVEAAVASPIEMSSTLSSSSSSSTSSSNSTVYSTPNNRQKSSSKSRTGTGSGSGSGRSRSKTKAQKEKDNLMTVSSSSHQVATVLPTKPEITPQKTGKSYSRKSSSTKSSTSATTAASSTPSLASALASTLAKEQTSSKEAVVPIVVHSSSSNSSCSLPSTPKMIATPPNESLLSTTNDSSMPFSPAASLSGAPAASVEVKDKLFSESFAKTKSSFSSSNTSSSTSSSLSSSSKKKSKSPSLTGANALGSNPDISESSSFVSSSLSAALTKAGANDNNAEKPITGSGSGGGILGSSSASSSKAVNSTPTSRGSKSNRKKSQQVSSAANAAAATTSSNIAATTQTLSTPTVTTSVSPLVPLPAAATAKIHPNDQQNPYQNEFNELDQVVSAISNRMLNSASNVVPNNQTNSLLAANLEPSLQEQLQQQQQQQQIQPQSQTQQHQLPTTTTNLQGQLNQGVLQNEDNISHTASDDNSILTLDDMLDSKFINEILNNADTAEINFDENELDPSSQQSYEQQPAMKRMRFEDGTINTMIPIQQQQQQLQVQQQQQQQANQQQSAQPSIVQQQQQQLQEHPQQLLTNVVAGDFAIFPQQSGQQQSQPQFGQFNTPVLEDLKVFNNGTLPQLSQIEAVQYQAELNKVLQQQNQQQQQQQPQLTTIDALQLQQLLYQQQDLNSAFMTGEIEALQQQQQQQQYQFCSEDDKTKQQLEAVGVGVGMGLGVAVDDKLIAFAQHENEEGAFDQTYANVAAAQVAAATQFNVFNVPSLTDDISVVINDNTTTSTNDIVLPNIVTTADLAQNGAQQFVLPSAAGEEQLIYEITANNQVAVMSQQRQQQVIAEFLSQAGYGTGTIDQVQNNSIPSLNEQENGIGGPLSSSQSNISEENFDDLDFSKIETFKSSSSNNNNNNSNNSVTLNESKTSMSGGSAIQNAKSIEDFYMNVHSYAGIPRPLGMNTFGIVKLPHCVSTAFKKSILVNRKAYANPLTSHGNTNSNGITGLTRFTSTSTIIKPVNEYTIGNITITNSPSTLSQQQQQQQQTSKAESGTCTGASVGGSVEIAFNSVSNQTTNTPTTQRGRQKLNASTPSGASGKGKMNAASVAMSPVSNVILPTSPITRSGSTTPSSSKALNISHLVASCPTQSEKSKIIKRSLITKPDILKTQNAFFTPKKISDMLSGKYKGTTSLSHLQTNTNTNVITSSSSSSSASQIILDHPLYYQHNQFSSDSNAQDAKQHLQLLQQEVMTEQQQKLNRVQNFYERRRKLLNLTNGKTNKINNNNNNSNINNNKSNNSSSINSNNNLNKTNFYSSGTINISGGNSNNSSTLSNLNKNNFMISNSGHGSSLSSSANNILNTKELQIIPKTSKPPQQILIKSQLMRTLSDYSFPTTIAQCKVTSSSTTNSNGNTNNNDMMRVFV